MENSSDNKNQKKEFLGIMFECCHVYGRIYKNKIGNAYNGYCPKCMRPIKIKIENGGTSNRFFNAG
ncbi:MAG: hypothetical protein JXR91_02290 [Deltaproteobacteria bacterium]|nr:hypothetical protein [Deltaproteobacteria bacterium]